MKNSVLNFRKIAALVLAVMLLGSAAAGYAYAAGTNRKVDLPEGTLVWIPETGEKFHVQNKCGNMNPDKAVQITVEEAKSRGYEACSKCY